jgi:hypothetical protein
MQLERDAWKHESRKFSKETKVLNEAAAAIGEAVRGYSDRNVDRNVKAFIENAKAGTKGVTWLCVCLERERRVCFREACVCVCVCASRARGGVCVCVCI